MSLPRRALIVIDAQQDYFDGLLPIQFPARDDSPASIHTAIDAAQQTDTPVVLVHRHAHSRRLHDQQLRGRLAAAAEPLGFVVEVLADATGAIDLANEAGTAPARQVHETLMALLHSNWAAVTDTASWATALRTSATLTTSDLVTSATQGRSTR